MSAATASSPPSSTQVGGTIDAVDTWLSAWTRQALGGVTVTLGPPGGAVAGDATVDIHLFELAHRHGRLPEGVELRYLVTAWSDDASSAHGLLGRVLVAAAAEPRLSVDVTAQRAEEWAAFGLAPRPSFVIVVPLGARPPVAAPRPTVREPLVVRLESIHGAR